MRYHEIMSESDDLLAWFGSSKIVDEQGDPLVCYHATEQAPFDAFDPERHGKRLTLPSSGLGIFFSPSDSVRHSYGPNVMRAYLRIERPYQIRLEALNRFSREDIPSWRSEIERKGHDGIIATVGSKPWEFVVFSPTQVKKLGWDKREY